MKTSELTGAALDWAVAKCVGLVCDDTPKGLPSNKEYTYKPSTDWAIGGPIIEENLIDIDTYGGGWRATKYPILSPIYAYGPTPLISAMRCYVSSKLGDEVEIPKELT